MRSLIVGDVQIASDGKTVWVSSAQGYCIGRFSFLGVDVHRDFGTGADGSECLDCVHDLPPAESWHRFVGSMKTHHGVDVPESVRPAFTKGIDP